MSDEKRLSLSYGDFTCDVVGYDDPFPILNRVFGLMAQYVETTPEFMADLSANGPDGALWRAGLASGLAESAAKFDIDVASEGEKLVIAPRPALTVDDAAESADDDAAPAEIAAETTEAELEEEAAAAPETVAEATVDKTDDAERADDWRSVDAVAEETLAEDEADLVEAAAEETAEEATEEEAEEAAEVLMDAATEEATDQAADQAAESDAALVAEAPVEAEVADTADAGEIAASGEDVAEDAASDDNAEDIAAATDDAEEAPRRVSIADVIAEFKSMNLKAEGDKTAEAEELAGETAEEISAEAADDPAEVAAKEEATEDDVPVSPHAFSATLNAGDMNAEPLSVVGDASAYGAKPGDPVDDKIAAESDEDAAKARPSLRPTPLVFDVVEDEEAEAAEAKAEEPAKAPKEEEKPALRRKPKIVIDKARSRPHGRTGPAGATRLASLVGRKDDAAETPEPSVAAARTSGPEDNFLFDGPVAAEELSEETAAKSAEELIFPNRAKTEVADEPLDVNPKSVVIDQDVSEPEIAAAEPAAEAVEPTKKKRSGLSLFGRRSEKADKAEKDDEPSREDAGFGRLRETAEADLPALGAGGRDTAGEAAETPLFAVSDAEDFSDDASPAAFVRMVGANSLQDLLEASAAYMAIVEGKAKFSRRDVMHALSEVGVGSEYSAEAQLKSFRKLVAQGALVKEDDGLFAISHNTRFGYETRLRA
ncbi:MAG: hypothetical protein AAF360_03530 [Pseudomonadota bacterium]